MKLTENCALSVSLWCLSVTEEAKYLPPRVPAAALPLLEEALAIRRQLSPQGGPNVDAGGGAPTANTADPGILSTLHQLAMLHCAALATVQRASSRVPRVPLCTQFLPVAAPVPAQPLQRYSADDNQNYDAAQPFIATLLCR